ncbi:TetR/AcrR family transcriptional regulator [Acidobacteria bacterium ACD]|nr:MAG: TetR/AcrR family transcriptional regulator [Acidobacteriota bacterium]MCE7957499.1 TetR/AcrR family transcriptional regulator [Acidobacteria bacterium ACB2]MDL1948556.1 TetR/AcrR family transcriptional regulator [Acidobacteria bacterium ACD]
MGIRERRERERQEVRTKILDAARELFARDGYEAVTMRKVADAVEYSPTAIYLHFPDKETLVRELCLCDFQSLAKALQRIAKEPDPLERLRKSGLAYVDFALAHPNHYRVMFMTPHPLPKGEEDLAALGKGNPEEDAWAFFRGTVAEAISAGRFRPDLTDPDLVAQALWAGVHGVVALHVAKKDDPWVEWRPARKTAALVVDGLLRGFTEGGR